MVLIGPDIFALFFGEQWQQAGEFARWMAPWLFLNLVYSPISTLFAVMERQKQVLALQIILLSSRTAAIGLGVWMGDILIAIAIFSLTSAFCYLGFIIWVGFMAGNSLSSLTRPLLIALVITIAVTSPVICTVAFFESTHGMWTAALAISADVWQFAIGNC